MAEQGFARRMMAQRLMAEKREDPFSDSRFFVGKMRPSLDDIEDPTRFSDMAMPAYSTAATGSLFAPGAGVTDLMGYAPDPAQPGEFLPSFGENIAAGNYLDAGLQTLGGAGDVMMAGGAFVPPLVGVGAALKAPRAARVAGQAADVVKIEDALRQKYPDVDLDVSETSQKLTLSKIVVPEGQRSSGVGTAVMSDLIAYADQRGLPVGLTPSTAFGGSKGRLQDFYKRFGFVPNKGRNKDFTFKETFVRQPQVLDPNQQMGDALAQAQARYFETGNFEPPTAENPVSVVLPTETEPGIIAFHGSGADFDEFRLEMIGTGEGAQAYGYGLYFTDSEDIAKFYRNTVSTGTARIPYGGAEDAAQAVPDNVPFVDVDGYRSYSMEDAEKVLESVLTKQYGGEPPEPSIVDFNIEILKRSGVLNAEMPDGTKASLLMNQAGDQFTLTPVKERTGKIYKVALSPKPDELLDHDAPFSQQSKDVQEKLIKAGYELDPRTSGSGNMIVESIMSNIAKARLAGRDESLKNINARLSELAKEMDKYSSGYRNFNDPRGQVLADEYDALLVERENLPTMTMSEARKLASQELAKAGIPGIKYRAAGSRGAGTTDEAAERNYVIFDDKAIKILEKYGIVGPVLVTGGAVAATQRGGDEEGSIFPDA